MEKFEDKFLKLAAIMILLVSCISSMIITRNEDISNENGENTQDSFSIDTLLKVFEYDSYNMIFEREIKDSSSTNNEIVKKVVVTQKVNADSRKIEVELDVNNKTNYIGGIYFNKARAELITSENESIFARYEDIFKIIKTGIPSLSKLADDLESINYKKYLGIIKNEIEEFQKTAKFLEYTNILKVNLEDKIVDLGKVDTLYNGKTIITNKNQLILTNKQIKEIIKQIVSKISNDEEIKKLISVISENIITEIEYSKEYEKIRMTSEEFNEIKENITEALINEFESIVSDIMRIIDQNFKPNDAEVVFNFITDSKGNLLVIESEEKLTRDKEIVLDQDKMIVRNKISFEDIGSITKSQIEPNTKVRINLAIKDRAGIFSAINIIKKQYTEVFSKAYNDLIENYEQ